MALKLSDAIRLGSMLGPQLMGDSQRDDGAGCALGSALMAIGVEAGYTEVRLQWPWTNASIHCPVRGLFDSPHCVWGVIRALNDIAEWTREQIADWVATIEPQLEPELQPELVPVLAHPAVREGR